MTAMERASANLMLSTIDQNAVLRHLNLNPSDPATQALLLVCEKYDLDPILKHALLIKGRLYVTRDGLLHVAHRSGVFDGMEVLEQGSDQTHFTAKVSVWRKDMGRPFTYIGRYPKSGQIARDFGPEMAVKVAEVMALRRAFDVALGAAEERWDEDAQEGSPSTNRSGRADVTREVQETAGTPAHTLSDPHQEEVMQRWATAIGDLATRVRRIAPADEVQAILDTYAWRTTTDAARACHTDLKALGLKHAPQSTQPAPQAQPAPTTVPAEALLTEPQRKALCAHASRAGATTSEDRASLWAYLLNSEQAIRTRELTDAQADVILGTFSTWSNDEAAQALLEAKKGVLPW